ncbi:MAG TPA: bacillithiol biosynthesis cysteine-adding enzyme BshC [Spirochaetia bacterium]|nr:bacillithiol biosynthesis cysteine-adding enzyme BshC [Spirochaetia bacterium]
MIHAIPLRELLSEGSLVLDCWEGSEKFRSLVPRWFRDPRVFAEQRDELEARHYDRATLRSVLDAQNRRFGAAPAAVANVARLSDPRALVVIGGQQAGLFGGPLYTAHKAMTVLTLAMRLETQLGQPVIPVFWIASEDSDLAEVDRATVIDRDGQLRELRLPGDENAKLPVSHVRLGEEIGGLFSELSAALPESDFVPDILASLRAAYAPGRTYPAAFGAWMAWLFSDKGLVLVDPSEPGLKRIALPLFEREVSEKSPVSRAMLVQTQLLQQAGYPAQIELRDGMLTLFYQSPAREAIAVRDDGFELRASARRFSNGDLTALIRERPEQFSPNAALRPLFQDSLFPTLAMVPGPSELAYWAQLPLAYRAMGIPMPVLVPRSSLTLVEPRYQRLMDKHQVSLKDIVSRGARVIDDIVRREIPQTLVSELGEGQKQVEDIWRSLTQHIERLDSTLRQTAELAAARSSRQFGFMDKKITQAARRKDEILRGQVERMAAALAPHGELQERTLTVLPFLARYGSRVVDQALGAIEPFAPEHRGVVIDS